MALSKRLRYEVLRRDNRSVASEGSHAWKAAVAAGSGSSDAFDAATEAGSSTAAYYLNAIAERARGEL